MSDSYYKPLVLGIVVVVAVAFAVMVWPFLLAVLTAAIFSGLLQPVYRKVVSAVGDREALAAAIVLLLAIVAVGVPVFAILIAAVGEGIEIGQRLVPWLSERLDDGAAGAARIPDWVPLADQLNAYREQFLRNAGAWLGDAGSGFLGQLAVATQGTIGFAFNLFVFLYAMFFFLQWGTAAFDSMLRYLPLDREDRRQVIDNGLSVTRATLKGVLVVGLIQAVLIGAALVLLGVDGALFWASLVVPLAAIPGLGTPIIWGPIAAYLLFQDRWEAALALAVWGGVVVGLVDNILRPRIVGQDARLPDLLVLVSTLGGIAAMGPIGIVIGPLLAGILVTALHLYRDAFSAELPIKDKDG